MLTLSDCLVATTSLLRRAGLDASAAHRCAYAIVLAEAWGIPSHGLLRLPYYLKRLQGGGCASDAALEPITDSGPTVAFDGQAGMGHWQLWEAAEVARDRCQRYGVGLVSVGNSSHCGALGVYTLPALEAGQATLVMSNGPAVMAPWGGREPVYSTSPFAAGLPTTPHWTIVDMATSAGARGRIAKAAALGEPIPESWALTMNGTPTTNAQAALQGMLAPFGGAKGAALALVVEALTGGIVGPVLSTDVIDMFADEHRGAAQRISHLVLTFDPRRLDSTRTGHGVRLRQLTARVGDSGGRLPGAARRPLEELDLEREIDVSEDLEELLRSGLAADHRP